jgi:cytochrome c553
MQLRPVRWLGIAAVLVVTGVALALLVAWLGIFNVAASAGHPAWVHGFLELGMRQSVRQHSDNIVPPDDLQSMDRIRLGAAHFAGGCAECHGAPGTPRNPVYEYMLPVPPDLTQQLPHWNASDLFFIVRHGLQFTGMPAWSGGERADEVWSVVSFLQALPALSVDEYNTLASGNLNEPLVRRAESLRKDGVEALARAACDRCHDTGQSSPSGMLVPRLAGQPAAYLARSLLEYRRAERRSGFMQPVAAMLSETEIEELAQHYSRMSTAPPTNAEGALSPSQQEEAASIANGTHPDLQLPACLSCHGAGTRADYPRLQGQNAEYIARQLQLWQNGGRQHSAWGQVMAVVAARLDAAQIDMLALWFSQQPQPEVTE